MISSCFVAIASQGDCWMEPEGSLISGGVSASLRSTSRLAMAQRAF
ncbi:hypothetical protein [Mesorhizobium sp. IMUNJ 23232]